MGRLVGGLPPTAITWRRVSCVIQNLGRSATTPGSPASDRLGFAGHETFAFRHGWLKKAVDAVRANPRALSSDRAIVDLGVGKNMVESIRHWGLATQVLTDIPQQGLTVSEIGHLLLEEWDPYLEHAASVWLLHWLLVRNPARAATWHYVFGQYLQPDFSKDDLVDGVLKFASRRGVTAKASTVSRDVDCLVRSYISSPAGGRSAPEDAFECPLADLLLIGSQRDGDTYRFAIGPKRTLPTQVVGFALLQFAEQIAPGRRTIKVGDFMYGPGSPGQVFKLDENSFVEYVEALTEATSGDIQFDDTAGLRQVYLGATIDQVGLLADHYRIGVRP
jgi:hypothetical protein